MEFELDSGMYAIIAPEHLENDEITRRVYRIVNNKKAGGFEFNGYKLYTFEAVRNIGPYKTLIQGENVGTVDCDYGALVVIPVDLIKKLENPYTLWFISSCVGKFFTVFQLEKEYTATYNSGVLKIDDIVVDTNVICADTSPDGAEMANQGELIRKISVYMMFSLLFHEGENGNTEDDENKPVNL